MGNYRFKLSDMIPNSWFYKLKDMGKIKTNNKNNNKTATTFYSKKNQTPTTTTITKAHCTPRKSYYFTRELIINDNNNNQNSNKIHHTSPPNNFPTQPRKSSPKQQQRSRRRKRRTSSTTTTTTPRLSISSPPKPVVSSGCSCRTTLESVFTKSADSISSSLSLSSSSPFDDDISERTDCVLLPTESSSSLLFHEMLSMSTKNTDMVKDVDKNSLPRKDDKLDGYGNDYSFSDLDLPPIITKPSSKQEQEPKKTKGSLKSVKVAKEEQSRQQKQSKNRGFSVSSSPSLKLRINNSPRLIGGRKAEAHQTQRGGRRSVAAVVGPSPAISGSFAVVKSSSNPMKDFRESMVEMIVENKIRESKDLEDLLACYLSLNSDEYHGVIIKVFKQIWFDLSPAR